MEITGIFFCCCDTIYQNESIFIPREFKETSEANIYSRICSEFLFNNLITTCNIAITRN